MTQHLDSWDDDRLDAALHDLGVLLVAPTSLESVRERVFSSTTEDERHRVSSPGRKARRIVASSAAVALLTTGGALAAAASGVLGAQAQQAF